MSDSVKGIFFTIVASVVFGFTPILARITYDGGSNPVMTTFLRSIFILPILIVILRRRGVPILASGRSFFDLFVLGGFSMGITSILLYMSFAYIPVGMATTLHFVYPVCVSIGCVVFFRDRMNFATFAALAASTAGIILFAGKMTIDSVTGMVLAVGSGLTFSFYMIYADKTTLKNNDNFKITFYICLVTAILSAAYGAAVGSLTLDLTPKAWLYAFLVSMLASVGGTALLQLGIKYSGATTASILCTFEPITSVACGALILGEQLTTSKILGCACIIFSVILISISSSRKPCVSGEAADPV